MLMQMSDLMKTEPIAGGSYQFYSGCMAVVQAAKEFSMRMHEIYSPPSRQDHE
jgi:hypothetical protein